MRSSRTTTILAALAAHQTVYAGVPLAPRQDTSACGAVSAKITELNQAGTNPVLNASDAYACLQEIPFDATRGANFIKEVRKHVEFQSDLAILKSPPDGFKPLDVMQGLSDIETKAANNGYSGQLAFDTDLYNLIAAANDEHFHIDQLCTFYIFGFVTSQPTALVSLADNATSQPQLYETVKIARGESASPITMINGKDAVEFLTTYSNLYKFQSADARYNSLFSSHARRGQQGYAELGRFINYDGVWQGNTELKFTYADGTDHTYQVVAGPQFPKGSDLAAWSGLTTGQKIYDAFCVPQSAPLAVPTTTWNNNLPDQTTDVGNILPTQTADASIAARQDSSQQPSVGQLSYPPAQGGDPHSIFTGYYLNDTHEDTAVLFMPTFETNGPDPVTGAPLESTSYIDDTYIPAVVNFIRQAVKDGKKKLIIDLSGNQGGTTHVGWVLYRIFFPTTNLYTSNRIRNHDFFRLVVEATATYNEDYTSEQITNGLLGAHADWSTQVNPDQSATGWTGYQNYIGSGGEELTAAVGFQNFSRPAPGPEGPTPGYGGAPNFFDEPTFAADNILLVTDGVCASTCSNFVEAIMQDGGVSNTLIWGGLPGTTIPQLVGGVRGSETVTFSQLSLASNITLDYVNNRTQNGKPTLSDDKIKQYKDLMPLDPSQFPLQFTGGSINLRNAYRNNSDLALQFDRQPAGCRLFYTAENWRNPGTQWSAAADATWGGGSGCKAPAPQGGPAISDAPTNSTGTDSASGTGTSTSSSSSSSSTNASGPRMMASSVFAGLVAVLAAVVLM